MSESKSLYPSAAASLPVIQQTGQASAYKKSLKWDIEKGDFVRDGGNRIPYCDGFESFRVWCMKMALTERYHCLAYPDALGVEMESAIKEPDNDSVEMAVEKTIKEALKVNPRTEYVGDFVHVWSEDYLTTTFTVKGKEWDEFQITI